MEGIDLVADPDKNLTLIMKDGNDRNQTRGIDRRSFLKTAIVAAAGAPAMNLALGKAHAADMPATNSSQRWWTKGLRKDGTQRRIAASSLAGTCTG